jgi:hypothetical protein
MSRENVDEILGEEMEFVLPEGGDISTAKRPYSRAGGGEDAAFESVSVGLVLHVTLQTTTLRRK